MQVVVPLSSTWQLGVTTTHMVSLPTVINCTSPLQNIGDTHVAANGPQTMDTKAKKKAITLTFDYMTDAEYDTVLQFHDGRQGDGPFAYQDPREPSPRTVNILNLDDTSSLDGYRDSGLQMILTEI